MSSEHSIQITEEVIKSINWFNCDYAVLDGERVEPHETLSLEKVSDIIKELTNLLH